MCCCIAALRPGRQRHFMVAALLLAFFETLFLAAGGSDGSGGYSEHLCVGGEVDVRSALITSVNAIFWDAELEDAGITVGSGEESEMPWGVTLRTTGSQKECFRKAVDGVGVQYNEVKESCVRRSDVARALAACGMNEKFAEGFGNGLEKRADRMGFTLPKQKLCPRDHFCCHLLSVSAAKIRRCWRKHCYDHKGCS